ncbi:MAG: hypothetical protein JKY96_01385 [Phycisphaerales bacterium]|nr:hypothetical protein [Phycisphaerales bacterium]
MPNMQNMQNRENNTTPQASSSGSSIPVIGGLVRGGWLWVSAGALAAMIVVQGSGLLDSMAYAEMSTTYQSYSMMTTDGGTDEILVILDSRQEAMLIYEVDSTNTLKLLKREQLDTMFASARAQHLPRP